MGGAELLVAPESWARRLNSRADDAIFRKDRGAGGEAEGAKKKGSGASKVYKMGGGKKGGSKKK